MAFMDVLGSIRGTLEMGLLKSLGKVKYANRFEFSKIVGF